MKRLCVIVALLATLTSLAVAVYAEDQERTRTLEVMGGAVFNVKTPLKIEQSGQPNIDIDSAEYDTKPFQSPIYYSVRFANWRGDRATEVELIHQKLFLQNGQAEVQRFDISHGFNMLFLNKAWKKDGLIFHFGGGAVITHPENTVRNLPLPQDGGLFDRGYYLSGAAVQFAVGKEIPISGRLFGVLEGKVTAAYAKVKVVDGHANVSNVALHGLFGVGYKF